MQSRKDAGSETLPGLRAILCFTLSTGVFCAAALAAPSPQAESSGAGAVARPTVVASEGFVGSEVCVTCHEETVKGFAENPHARLTSTHAVQGGACESCHGAGKAHVDGHGDKTKIVNPAGAAAEDVDALCQGCHKDKHEDFARSAHAGGNVSCLGCHSIHQSKTDDLLKAPQPVLCFKCHADDKQDFSMPVHHKVNEGLVQCSDCHDVHGVFERKALKSVSQQNAACTKCHTEIAGPWKDEHSVVKSEGCVGCHIPHGGPNPHLLNRAEVSTICLQCHAPATNLTAGTPPKLVHTKEALRQPCTTCHVNIHGSNTSRDFLPLAE